jgi:microtubule-associated protein-like 6
MGCISSTFADEPQEENQNGGRLRLNKKTGEPELGDIDAKDEEGFFEAMDAGEGEQFMAVRPYVGAIVEPASHPAPNPAAPTENWQLTYVYGYKCEEARQNVFLNPNGETVYMTAALGVILNTDSNT